MKGWSAALCLSLWGCRPDPAPLVLLVSWDTTRADALGCYAEESHWGLDLPASVRPTAHTPVADGLAADGVRFSWALAHAPTTLSSHSSIFSGLDPHGHQVVRNGFPIPGDVPLLAERFAAAGWDTLAVVGASVLESDMGLSRGFRTYDDDVSTRVRRRFEDDAAHVVDRALKLADDRRSGVPVFLFVHFFDAHSPWDGSSPDLRAKVGADQPGVRFDGSGDALGVLISETREGTASAADRAQARALYLAEVAGMDRELGRLLDGLDDRGLGKDRLVLLLGDHGETLDEVPARPYGHGLDVDLVDVHVPLIVSARGRFKAPAGRVEPGPARLMDVGSTLLSVSGVGGSLGLGVDLSARWGGGAQPRPGPSFAEATKPAVDGTTGGPWNNLSLARSVAFDGRFVTMASVRKQGPALFALAPGQPPLDDLDARDRLWGLLHAWNSRAPTYRNADMDADTTAALRALGYLDARPDGEAVH